MSTGFDPGGPVGATITSLQPASSLMIEPGAVTPDQAARVAVIAGWCTTEYVTQSQRALVAGLTTAGYATLLVLATENPRHGLWPTGERPESLTIIRRPNAGYDFGSWAVGINSFPNLRSAQSVLLVNDSLVGPFGSLVGVVQAFESANTDVWGLCESTEISSHLQSFWLGFRKGVLSDRPLARYWRDIAIQPTKDQLIQKYEVGFAEYLRTNGYQASAMFPAGSLVRGPRNPSHFGWKQLLESGVPMVKRDLVTNSGVTPDSDTIPAFVKDRYGVNISDWISH